MSGSGFTLRTPPTPATPLSLTYMFAAQTMLAGPSTSYLFPGNGVTSNALVTVVGSFAAPFNGNLNTFQVNHRNPSGASNITHQLEIEGVVQGAATIVLSSGAAGPVLLATSVPILQNQRFNCSVILLAGAPVNFRPVWQCILTAV